MSSPCTPNVSKAGNLAPEDSEALLQQISNRAKIRAADTGQSIKDAMRDIAGEIKADVDYDKKKAQRDHLLNVQAKMSMKNLAKRFPTYGEGLRALLVGSNKLRQGGRLSVDYQAKFTNGKYFNKFVSGLENAGVLRDFKKADPEWVQDVYREMGGMQPGQPAKQVTKNKSAFMTAQILDGVYAEMVARQNRAGGGIIKLPGYIIRQTHDMSAIRSVGRLGNNAESKAESYKNWWDFTKPLLDHEKTFKGSDPDKVSRLIHENLYTGKHDPSHEETDAGYATGKFSNLGDKISKERVLHFKDADSAYKYNQAFGIKNFREAVISDIHSRARQIALMENLGPHFERNFEEVKNELLEEARDNSDKPTPHQESLRDWKLQADFNEVTGKNEFSANPTLTKFTNFLKINAQLSKMGAVVLSKTVDAGAITSEMAHQGMNSLGALGHGIANMIHTSADDRAFARKLGVGMEALIGNSLSRFQEHSSVYGWSHEAQKKFYSMSLLPRWNDALRSSVAVALSNHLGENSHLPFEELPGPLRNILTQYDIHGSRWDALRSTAYDHNGSKFISPDMLHQIPDEIPQGVTYYRGGRKKGEDPSNKKTLFVTSDKDAASAYGDVKPVKLNLKNTANEAILKAAIKKVYPGWEHEFTYPFSKKTFAAIQDAKKDIPKHNKAGGDSLAYMAYSKKVQDELNKQGYDSAKFTEIEDDELNKHPEHDTIIVFNPKESVVNANKQGISIADLVISEGLKPTDANIARMRDKLETSLGTYFADRADIAIPTPGAKERKFATFGTQAGTPLGESLRLMMMFKSFPITIMSKILGRDIYGNGADTVKQWLLNDNRGKFNMAMTIAMMTAAGYVSQTLHDLTKGKGPMPLVSDGKVNWNNLQQIAVRGGSLGLFGETTMGEFSGQYRSYLEYLAGPTFGQLDNVFNMKGDLEKGKNVSWPATKLLLDNAPFTNLFYFRPILDYLVLWNLQAMMSPGSLERSESRTETQNHQRFIVKPSEHVNK